MLTAAVALDATLRYVGLQEVSFPIALMSKSCKLIVVMLGGVLLLAKKYHLRDYAAAAAIVAGLFIFQHDSAKSSSSTAFGIGVLLVSLLFDSLNSNYNEKVVAVNRCNPLTPQTPPPPPPPPLLLPLLLLPPPLLLLLLVSCS